MNDFPEVLRKLRVNAKHSQEFVAKKIDISLSTYSRIERGEVEMDFQTVIKVAHLYKLTVDELIHYGNPEFKVAEPKESYFKKWAVPVMVSLDGTDTTLEMWMQKLTAINKAI